MTGVLSHKGEPQERELYDPLEHTYEDWARPIRTRWPDMFPVRSNALQLIPVDEYRDQGVTVVRAEIPGIDPARDVEVFVCDGLLRIKAERRDKAVFGERTYIRKEIRSGSLLRVLPMPSGVKASDVTSTYTDGILEVRIGGPAPAPSSQ